MSTAADRVEEYLDTRAKMQGLSQKELHSVGHGGKIVNLMADDLRLLIKAAREADVELPPFDEADIDRMARQVYLTRSASPGYEIGDDRWERIKTRFPGSYESCRLQAIEELEGDR